MQKSRVRYPDIEHYPETRSALSFQQERVLYLNQLSAEGNLWNRISCKRLLGNLDVHLLEQAVAALIERHAALRTRIGLVDGVPFQSQHLKVKGAFQYLDLSSQVESGLEAQAKAVLNREYEKPMPLEGGELFKTVVVRLRENEVWVILKLHHIICDATTLEILWNDLKVLYNSRLEGAGTVPELEFEYFDYARWLRQQFGEDQVREQESYWLQQFAGELPQLDLPTDFPDSPTLTFRGALERRRLPQSLIKRLQSFSFERRVIPFATLLSAYYLLLHNYCRQDDIVIGTIFSGRHYSAKIKLLAGLFANTVALRARLDPGQTVEGFLKYVHGQVADAYEMQDYPFERLVSRLSPDRQHQRNPLFRALFNMIPGRQESRTFQGINREEWVEPTITATQVDLFLDCHLHPEEPELRLEYNTDIFSPATIQRMLRHYLTLLEKIMDSPSANARGLGMLDAAEEKLVLSLGKCEAAPAPFTRSIVELLEERAARAPAQAAILHGAGVITNGEFNRRVNHLAARLMEAGVGEGDTVAIMLDRAPEMVVGVFAILKAGAAYLPIDPAFPRRRVEYILEDSGAGIILMPRDAPPELMPSIGSLNWIPVDSEASASGDGSNPGRKGGPGSAAYVLYTSGSTGRPKGVLVEHRALMNTLEFLEAQYPINGNTFLFKTNFTFDVSATELFGWVFGDGKLAVLDKGAEKDPRQLLEAIEKYQVTHINFVPSMLDAFLSGLEEGDIPTLEKLRYLFVAGEALKGDLVNRFHRMVPGVKLENLYGPTEAAIYATWHSLPRGEESPRVPIGTPITNTMAYILDENLKLAPVGVTGELCLSGVGLARGYLNRPELTKEKFCPDPYREGERIYRTGDLARWGDDGLIQFFGRRDGQVKIRGFRVEIGEIERRLLSCRAVAEAVVKATTEQFDQKGLVAYVSLKEGEGDGSLEGLRQELAAWLPNYMIPDFFVKVDGLPRLASGKVDLQRLPEPQRVVPPSPESRQPATALEQEIIGIAEGLLNTAGLDPSSNFFRLGGNSLLTLRFVAALNSNLGANLAILDFLELPTISEIARLVEASRSLSQMKEARA
jgi:amino acid adenylation domain-containing protein